MLYTFLCRTEHHLKIQVIYYLLISFIYIKKFQNFLYFRRIKQNIIFLLSVIYNLCFAEDIDIWQKFSYLQNMQSVRQCVKHLALYGRSAIINRTNILPSTINLVPACSFHISAICRTDLRSYEAPIKFLRCNKTVFPPQQPGEERRPAVSYIMQIY